MTSKERKGRELTVTVKSVSAKPLQLARASKGNIVEIPLDIRRRFDMIALAADHSLSDRSYYS